MKIDVPTILPFSCTSTSVDRRVQRNNLLEALRFSGSPVILDFSGCNTLNHEDLGLLLECMAQVTARDTKVLLVAGSPANRVLLEVTRISSLVPVVDSVAEALVYPHRLTEGDPGDLNADKSQIGSA